MNQIPLHFIQHDDELGVAIDSIFKQKPSFIAIDTEFTRKTTYWPQLELIQIGIPNEPILVIDCKEIKQWSPLVSLLQDTKIVKVFHSARQDLEGFLRLFGQIPTSLFDIQIAAAFMGFGHSVGLGDLVEQLLGESPNKSEQHSNWQARPLRPAQISYAAMDAHYLIELYPLVVEQLVILGRLSWLNEFCELLEDQNRLITNPDLAWVKLRSHLKNEVELYFCKAFSALRESLAQQADYNRTRVINDKNLIALSQNMALFMQKCVDGVAKTGLDLPDLENVETRFLDDFLHMQQESIKGFDTYVHSKQLRTHLRYGLGVLFNGVQQKQLSDAKVLLSIEANRLVIPVNYLAPSMLLDNYIISPHDDHPLVSGWRKNIILPIMNKVMKNN